MIGFLQAFPPLSALQDTSLSGEHPSACSLLLSKHYPLNFFCSGEKKGIPPAGICHSSGFVWQGIQEKVLPFTLTKLIPINSCHNTPLEVQLWVSVTEIKLKYNSKINSLLLWSGQHTLARTPLTGTIHPLWQYSFYSHTSPCFDLTLNIWTLKKIKIKFPEI